MRQAPIRIRWHKPISPTREGLAQSTADMAALGADRLGAAYEILLQVGIPVAEGVETAPEFAVELLKLAAEVEHALMAQYLYAAASVPDEPGPDLVNYREKLMDVAVQEMGHLATVQNLLLLLGGREALYLQRDLVREASERNPIPFVLEPVSKTSLAKYVAVEKPAQVPPALAARVDELVTLAEENAGVETHRVGAIYLLLQWMFTPAEEAVRGVDLSTLAPLPACPHISDGDLRDALELEQYEALPEEWQVFEEDVILATAHSCAEARDAIARIAEQGEGLQDKDTSHFGEFLEMVTALEAGDISVRPIAKSPTVGGPGGQGGESISHPYTRLWGEVFSLQYNLLVLTIYHALVTPRRSDGGAGLRADLTNLALRVMRQVIQSVSDLVGSLPLRAAGGPDRAGPPYDLDPVILESHEDSELRDQHLRMLDRLVTVYRAIEESPDFASHPDHPGRLANLRIVDRRRRDLFV